VNTNFFILTQVETRMKKRLEFDSQGRLLSVDNSILEYTQEQLGEDSYTRKKNSNLRTSKSLGYINGDEKSDEKFETIFDTSAWSLYQDGGGLKPLRFSNGKTQEDVVKEIVDLIKGGKKVIFLHGTCGTGKSAIALNVARLLGRASVVVPVKALQRQYEEEYMGKKYLLKKDGKKMKIAMMTGRDNHDSIIEPGVSCADPFLPDTIRLSDKNYEKIKEYYLENPYIRNTVVPSVKRLRRISIAPANPYWSPIITADYVLDHLKDADKKRYKGLDGKEFIFYHRKKGCSYYDQYQAYINSDVIIFNSAKYLLESAMGRKPQTNVEIIDEADEFLDKLSNQVSLNLTRLSNALKMVTPDGAVAEDAKARILKLIENEEKNKRAIGVDEGKIEHVSETKIGEILGIFLNQDLETDILLDEMNYANTALEAARNFKDLMDDVYVSFRKEEDNLLVSIVTTNLSKKFKEIVDKNKAVILMSGTLHSDDVIRGVFDLDDYGVVEAETLGQGSIEICMTGKEFDCKYSNFQSKSKSREDYIDALSACVGKAEKPLLVHVNAYADLPSEMEKGSFGVTLGESVDDIMSREQLKSLQGDDKTGKQVSVFREGLSDKLFTTKCSRGVDFPGNTCKSIIFTKYPNPNVKDTFWKVLKKTHPDWYWEFYRDKAYREFLQRIYRAVRSPMDHVYILSPDSRVLNAVKKLQANGIER
jgi:Rad3-related DNA helicase